MLQNQLNVNIPFTPEKAAVVIASSISTQVPLEIEGLGGGANLINARLGNGSLVFGLNGNGQITTLNATAVTITNQQMSLNNPGAILTLQNNSASANSHILLRSGTGTGSAVYLAATNVVEATVTAQGINVTTLTWSGAATNSPTCTDANGYLTTNGCSSGGGTGTSTDTQVLLNKGNVVVGTATLTLNTTTNVLTAGTTTNFTNSVVISTYAVTFSTSLTAPQLSVNVPNVFEKAAVVITSTSPTEIPLVIEASSNSTAGLAGIALYSAAGAQTFAVGAGNGTIGPIGGNANATMTGGVLSLNVSGANAKVLNNASAANSNLSLQSGTGAGSSIFLSAGPTAAGVFQATITASGVTVSTLTWTGAATNSPACTDANGYLTTTGCSSGGGGGGGVNSGTVGQNAYYAVAGTTVSGSSNMITNTSSETFNVTTNHLFGLSASTGVFTSTLTLSGRTSVLAGTTSNPSFYLSSDPTYGINFQNIGIGIVKNNGGNSLAIARFGPSSNLMSYQTTFTGEQNLPTSVAEDQNSIVLNANPGTNSFQYNRTKYLTTAIGGNQYNGYCGTRLTDFNTSSLTTNYFIISGSTGAMEPTNDAMVISINPTVASYGFVGINKPTPIVNLDVNGTVAASIITAQAGLTGVTVSTTIFVVTSSTQSSIINNGLLVTGRVITSTATPTILSCGTTPSGSVVGNDVDGKITIEWWRRYFLHNDVRWPCVGQCAILYDFI